MTQDQQMDVCQALSPHVSDLTSLVRKMGPGRKLLDPHETGVFLRHLVSAAHHIDTVAQHMLGDNPDTRLLCQPVYPKDERADRDSCA